VSTTESKTKSKAAAEEPKQALPVGHPKAGYAPPDLSFVDGVELGEEPSIEEAEEAEKPKTREENIAAREEAVKAAEENEDKVAKEETKAREEYAEKLAAARDAQVEKQVASGAIPEPVPPPSS
jgi:hypothetical protein